MTSSIGVYLSAALFRRKYGRRWGQPQARRTPAPNAPRYTYIH